MQLLLSFTVISNYKKYLILCKILNLFIFIIYLLILYFKDFFFKNKIKIDKYNFILL